MSRSRTAILAECAVEPSVPVSSPKSARRSRCVPRAEDLRIALTYTAMLLQRILPMVWAAMPDKAPVVVCLASGCRALAGRMA